MKQSLFLHSKGVWLIFIFALMGVLTGCTSDEPYVYVCTDGAVAYEELSGKELVSKQSPVSIFQG